MNILKNVEFSESPWIRPRRIVYENDDGEVDTDPFGNSHYEVTGGGNSDIDFCSKFLVATEPRSYDVVEFRQL